MLRLLHTSGLSLGDAQEQFGAQAPVRQEDFFRTFERLLDLGRSEQVQLLLVTGDLFSGPRPAPETLERVRTGLAALEADGIQPVLLPGSGDDSLVADAVYRRGQLPGVVLNPRGDAVLLETAGHRVRLTAGGAWSEPSADALEIALAAVPVPGLAESFAGADRPGYLALGGAGEFQVLTAGERVFGCRPGAAEGRNFSETGPRQAALVTWEDSGLQIRGLPVQSRQLLERPITLTGNEDDRALASLIREAAAGDAAVRVVLEGAVEQPLDVPALHAAAAGAFFFLELQDRTRLGGSRMVARLAAEDTVRGLCLRRILERLEQADAAEAGLLEAALREIMSRLQLFPGNHTP